MNYEEMIINKVMNSDVVFVDNKTAKDKPFCFIFCV